MTSYFETIDSELKAYLFGVIVFNIHNVKNSEVYIELNCKLPTPLDTALKQIACVQENSTYYVINSVDVIRHISKHLNVDDLSHFYNIDITYFVKNNKREHVIEFLKAFYEKNGGIRIEDGENACIITTNNKQNLTVFADFCGIPYTLNNIFNLSQILYTGSNIIDLLGIIYRNPKMFLRDGLYRHFLQLLNSERPTLKFVKITEDALTPSKTNFSDVGFDLSIIGEHSVISKKNCTLVTGSAYNIPITKLYRTGIKLEIPVGYYVEIVPRSSLSKTGYMMANSIGIIDCSYKGELLVALAKINRNALDIQFPFRCCQLIMRKQIFADMVEIQQTELTDSNRGEGGFGSTTNT
jgi:deoxyuridine 5'-triphosphate nucleotidohydrolase